MTNIDIVLGIILLAFIIWGTIKGLLWTLIRFASLAGIVIGISLWGRSLGEGLRDLLNLSSVVAGMISYLIIVVVILVISHIVYKILNKVVKGLKLGCANRIAGGIFFGVEFVIILALIVILIDISPLSLNGRGVRPRDYNSSFDQISALVEKEINQNKNQISEMDLDRLWEALDESGKEMQNAKGSSERELVMSDLYKTIQSSVSENTFTEIYDKVQKKQQDVLKFKGDQIEVNSLILELMIEPVADYIESRFMGYEIA